MAYPSSEMMTPYTKEILSNGTKTTDNRSISLTSGALVIKLSKVKTAKLSRCGHVTAKDPTTAETETPLTKSLSFHLGKKNVMSRYL